MTQEEEDALKDISDFLWSKGNTDVGLITTASEVQITPKSTTRPHQKQYPLRKDAEEGVDPLIKELLEKGVLFECPDSPCNTPLFPVRKEKGEEGTSGWRLVQDLQAVNNAI